MPGPRARHSVIAVIASSSVLAGVGSARLAKGPELDDQVTSCCWPPRSDGWPHRRPARLRILTWSCTKATRAQAPASTSSGSPAITSTAARNRCRRSRASWRGTTASSAASSSRPIRRPDSSNPGSSNISGLEALKTADLLVVFLRFQDFPDDQMQHIVDYLDRGGPGRRLSHRDARLSDQAAGCEVPEIHVEQRGEQPRRRFRRGLRPPDPRRDVGLALRRATTSRARDCCCSRRASTTRSCAASKTSGRSRAATRPIRSPAATCWRWARS